MKKLLWISLVFVLCFASLASASIDAINSPYDGEIVNSPAIDLEIDTTGSTYCYWTYAYPANNYSISCAGEKIRLPKTEGDYNITISDNTGDLKSVVVTLDYPDGFVIVFYSLGFLIICFSLVGLLLMSIFKTIELEMDAKDLTLNISAYIVLLAFYFLCLEYLGNPSINTITYSIVQIGGFTNLFIPIIAFFVTFFKRKSKEGFGNG